MRIVIVGASGLIGSNLLREANARGHDATGTYRSFGMAHLVHLDLGAEQPVNTLFSDFRPTAVVCCAAWSWVDGCQSDRERAFRENAENPAMLARAAYAVGASFVYLSSSYIFDGQEGPYTEEAEPNPLSVYGRSKLAGELAVVEATGNAAVIVRTMGVYGPEPQEKNFVYQVRRNLGARREMKVPNDQFGNASFAGDIAHAILLLLQDYATGIWNVAGPEPRLSRLEFARRIAREYQMEADLLREVTTSELGQPAPRPRQAGLLIGKMTTRYDWTPTNWERIP